MNRKKKIRTRYIFSSGGHCLGYVHDDGNTVIKKFLWFIGFIGTLVGIVYLISNLHTSSLNSIRADELPSISMISK